MNYQQLLEQVKHHVIQLFKTKRDSKLVYHNLAHTESVVSNAAQIARHYQLDEKDFFIVMTAAWFHDTGYLTGGAQDHEIRGAELGSEVFEREAGRRRKRYESVRQCIMATRMPQSPVA